MESGQKVKLRKTSCKILLPRRWGFGWVMTFCSISIFYSCSCLSGNDQIYQLHEINYSAWKWFQSVSLSPLTFCSTGNYGGDNFSVLSRIASVIFYCSPALGDVDSSSGKVLSPSHQFLFSSNSQFHRLSQRGLLGGRATTNTPRKGSKKTLRNLSLLWGNLASFPEGIKRNLSIFLIILIVSANGSVQKTVLIPKRT